MKELITYLARNLVEHPTDVQVTEAAGDRTEVFELRVATSDLGKVIGKQGRTIRALRTLVNAAAAREGKRAVLEVVE